MERHRHLDYDLDNMRNRVLLLGGKTETALARAMFALVERDTAAAEEVLRDDDQIDQLELEIDRLCIDVLALRQPAARDLRFVVSVAKVTPILERIADHACNIARAAIDLNDEPQLKFFAELPRMAARASAMLRAALDAFTTGNAAEARSVIDGDDEIDALYEHMFQTLIALMSSDPTTTGRGARLLLIAKHLERVGDYVTDICELTVYMAEAAFIKHSN
ncbi:MAG: phosphate transport system protein [Pyrinomonadaceae bacterium]|jgi:phosphate transport system protein|nr:phosphate transport system protein [Pyrinomonadaceae bacterium]